MYERQLILNNIELFASNSKSKFYEKILDTIDLSDFPKYLPSKFGPKGYDQHALFRSFIVMKAEKLCEVTQLLNPKYFSGKKNRGCINYISIGTDYCASINRESISF